MITRKKTTFMASKIFGIGLSRTGTSTLINAFGVLGYKAIHFPFRADDFDTHEAAADTPVAARFVELDKIYPGSRFVYTTRDLESWLASCERFWAKRQVIFDRSDFVSDMHRYLYQTTTYDADKFAAAYRRHDSRIREYFATRPDDWLEFDICGGAAEWPPLCDFLGRERPSLPFPWSNRGDIIDQMLIRALHVLDDVELVGRITNVSPVHLKKLTNSNGYADHDVKTILAYDDGAETAYLATRLCQGVGGAAAAAETFGFDQEKLEISVEFVNARH